MEKDKIPTAEELFESEIEAGIVDKDLQQIIKTHSFVYKILKKRIIAMTNKHARNHVKAALEAASENASLRIEETNTSIRYKSHSIAGSGGATQTWIIAKDSILNSYPENLIQ